MKKTALIIRSHTLIAPFAEHAEASAIHFSTLRQLCDDACAQAGFSPRLLDSPSTLELNDDDLVLVCADSVFVSHKAMRDFVRLAQPRPNARLSLRRTPSVDYTLPITDLEATALSTQERETARSRMARLEKNAHQRVDYDVFLLLGKDMPRTQTGAELLAALRKQCTPLIVPKREIVIPVRLPILGNAGAQTMAFPITSTIVAEVRSWVHILWLNQLYFGVRWMDLLRRHKLWACARVLAAFPFSRARLFKSFVRIGKGCRIHPTAHIELSEIGDNVVIGAGASIRNSFVGSGSYIGEHAALLSSTVGENCHVTPKTFIVWSAAYPGATLGNYKLQVSLIGRDAHINPWAGLIDAKFKGAIRVEHEGQMRSTERSFLGSCVGHNAVLAAKVLIQPGRMIPNNTVVVMRPDEVISHIPDNYEPGVPLVRDQGTLVPLEQLRRG